MFRIGEFSKLCGLTIDTLYHYEKMKLLEPAVIDKFSNYRYYDAGQLVTVNKIMALKDASFSLEEIAEVLNQKLPLPSLIHLLENKSLTMEEELLKEMNRLDRLRTNIFLIKNGGIPQMNEITIKSIEPIRVASIRRIIPSSRFDEELTDMWTQVNEYIDRMNGKRTVPCMMLYHIGWADMDSTSMLEVEVVEPITKSFPGNEEIKVYELPTIDRMVCIVHKGPFST
ncbi:MAG: transcriptional activator ligand binding domain protein, partial [Firmicutes bacterium]|nr:transcriptional activator ligand binding domain protein [Bacillota bacterium]